MHSISASCRTETSANKGITCFLHQSNKYRRCYVKKNQNGCWHCTSKRCNARTETRDGTVVEESGFHCHVENAQFRTISRSLRKLFSDSLFGESPNYTRLDYTFNVFAINLHRRRSLPSVCWDCIRYCVLFLASTIFAFSCAYICDFVVFSYVFSCAINVQQFRQFLRFCNSSVVMTATSNVTDVFIRGQR